MAIFRPANGFAQSCHAPTHPQRPCVRLRRFHLSGAARQHCGDTSCPERETDLAFQMVVPAHCLLFRTGINDRFALDAVSPDRISLGPIHNFASRIRRTEVRPICTRRAISDLLTPARCSFRISAAWTTAVAGLPVAFRSAEHAPNLRGLRSAKTSRSNATKTTSKLAMARPAGVVRSNA